MRGVWMDILLEGLEAEVRWLRAGVDAKDVTNMPFISGVCVHEQ
jgi:hypothetical protein